MLFIKCRFAVFDVDLYVYLYTYERDTIRIRFFTPPWTDGMIRKGWSPADKGWEPLI